MPYPYGIFLFHLWIMQWICYNGSFLPKDQPVFTIENRNFRFGDGVFETMKVKNGNLSLPELHYDRLNAGLKALQLSIPGGLSLPNLLSKIIELCHKNNCY